MSLITTSTPRVQTPLQHKLTDVRPEGSGDGVEGTHEIEGICFMLRKPPRRPRGRPRSTGTNPTLAFRWPQTIVDAIERYAKSQALDRAAAVKQIVVQHLIAHGELSAE
jgi:hypothetical protein